MVKGGRMKKKTNKNHLKYNLIFIFFMGFVFFGIYRHYDYMKNKDMTRSREKAEKLLENHIENTAIKLKKNSERHYEYKIIDKGEFDFLLLNKKKIWKIYNTLERKWEVIDLLDFEKMYEGENKGIINYRNSYYIYGGILKGTEGIFSIVEINKEYFDDFLKKTGVEIVKVKRGKGYLLESLGEKIDLEIDIINEKYESRTDEILGGYIIALFLLTFLLSYVFRIKMKSLEESILEDITLIKGSRGKSEVELDENLEFYRVRQSLIKLGKSYYKKNNELYKLKGDLTKTNLELRALAITDKLTGLYNKRFLYEMLEGLKKEEVEAPYHNILMMIDLDNFKKLNDTNGHIEGDILLQALGSILKDIGRGWGTAFRYGGDEFLIVFKKLKYEDFLDIVSEFELAKKNIMVRYEHVELGVSAGVMILDDLESYDPDNLIKMVDDLLYEAKKNGKNQIVFKV